MSQEMIPALDFFHVFLKKCSIDWLKMVTHIGAPANLIRYDDCLVLSLFRVHQLLCYLKMPLLFKVDNSVQ